MGSKEKKRVEDMSLEELEAELYAPRERKYRPGMYYREPKVVSTEKVVCRARRGEVHTALLLIYDDKTIGVKCPGRCSDCEYGLLES